MSFRTAKSRLKIDKDGDMGRPKGRLEDFGGRVGGRGGRPGNLVLLVQGKDFDTGV